ncbi:MAG: hypothetical protein K8I27_06265 [Planctomycetes bacterium]|nr:hypothetical protein [Planctomycetota bacterium]
MKTDCFLTPCTTPEDWVSETSTKAKRELRIVLALVYIAAAAGLAFALLA